jgi:tripartite-type tricarboxylate transporter receptor subunit TctC
MRVAKILAVCGVALAALLAPASAQDVYPSRTIRLIVGFPPGGGVDAVARLFADKMTGIMGQPVVVVNQGGAAGGIAAKKVSTEEPDGYSVLVNSNSMVIYSLMTPKAGLNVERDLYAVAAAAPQAIVLAGAPDLKANNLKELIELAKTKPLNYGTPGTGSIPHLVIEQLLTTLPGVKLQNVPFQGAAPAWSGFFVPPKTPKAVVDKLEQAILQAASLPDIKEKLTALGFEPTSTPGAKFRTELSAEIKTWSAVLEKANLIQQ